MKNPTLAIGDSEMEVLQHVWELKHATVAQVHERILKNRKVAYTTVMTMMQNLAKKGFLTFEKEGVTYVYAPAIDPGQVRQDLLSHLMMKVFKGSPTSLIQTLVEHEAISDEERESIKSIIKNME
ncbi:MAG: BlaI/MecI/CopY family transcriptional regulator [Bacteroidetes bacterium]|nr:BlaI/MecI/CopY family transcriptional regulator [Bacteroidota bacterium]MCH8523329.1 BlaI/MecI/CopY family transcriptional regulator [Balneolales bacterium]